MVGRTLGHYRILEKIGAGGMGEVFRARDSKLDRDVALKVLPEAFTSDPDRLALFEREAKVLASLNHPNIGHIYGLEEADGVKALVLELVEGPTLADRIAQGPIPLDEALPIAKQIAEALEAAHEKGTVHRDLKPSNIKVTEAGTVKVLDFGLAKALEPETAPTDPSRSPTISEIATRSGVILGTATYMSPEQARGARVDKRADVWAFGCVLYEMLTAKRTFHSDSVQDTLAAVLRSEPDWDRLPPGTPASLRKLLRRCLEKDPKRRLHDIADARIEIEDALAGAPEPVPYRGERVSGWSLPLTWILLGLIALLAALLVWNPWRSESLPRSSAQLSINLPEEAPLAPAGAMPLGLGRPSLALSPDGSRLVYVALVNGRTQLYVREMSNGEIEPIPGTEGGYIPFFSPDGEWVGFFADEKLKKVSLAGGEPIVLADAPLGNGGSWAADDTIYFVPNQSAGISKVSASGGPVEIVTKPSGAVFMHLWPQVLPGGKGVLFSLWGGGIAVYSLESSKQKTILETGWAGRYFPTGHLIYSQVGKLLAVSFDLTNLEVTGPPVTVLEGVRTEMDGEAQFSISQDGLLAYAPGVHAEMGTFMWLDRKGNTQPLGLPPGIFEGFSLSPDGRTVAIPIQDGTNIDIWLFDILRGTPTRFTFDGLSYRPIWTPDGKKVVFTSQRDGVENIFWKPADGSSEAEQLTENKEPTIPASLSPDGKVLAFTVESPETTADIFLIPFESENPSGAAPAKPIPFLQTPFLEIFPVFSPDGRWIAYTSDESGRWEIYVRPYPGHGGRARISTEGGEEPIWSRDGRKLFYRYGSRWYVVDLDLGAEFRAGTPRLLFEGPYINVFGYSYDVSPDGERFLVIEGAEQEKTLTELVVLTNWFDELRRRVPSGKK
ncbi:serine/threonine-protein kinase [Acidobacteriia bacterium AH_259_A11_L15]|nr:serine/threonine-protein kinase [Acidobacteriia bacterium AH_259_A11_L15]